MNWFYAMDEWMNEWMKRLFLSLAKNYYDEKQLGNIHLNITVLSDLDLASVCVCVFLLSFGGGECSVMIWTTNSQRNYTIGVNYLSALLGY